jgi:hypothetical protein
LRPSHPYALIGFRIGRLCLTSLCMWLALTPGTAFARRPATPVEQQAISRSVRLYTAASGCCATSRFRVLTPIWVSTKDRDFAIARIRALGQNASAGPSAAVVLIHTYSRKWVVIALGSARLACALPNAIRHDLRLPSCS